MVLNPETLPIGFEAESREKAWEQLHLWVEEEVELKGDEGG